MIVMKVETHDRIGDLLKGTPCRRHHPGTTLSGHWGPHLGCGHSASRNTRNKCQLFVSSWLSWQHEWTRQWLWFWFPYGKLNWREIQGNGEAQHQHRLMCFPVPRNTWSQKGTSVPVYSECCTSRLQKINDWWVRRLQLMPVTFETITPKVYSHRIMWLTRVDFLILKWEENKST